MSDTLTRRQQLILARMLRRNIDRDGAESGIEMAQALWCTGAFTSVEQGQRTCEQLVRKGLAVRLGASPTRARTYGPAKQSARSDTP
jgi:hypothetical protein